jgi:hypothetical protein
MRLFAFRSSQLPIIAFKESLCPPTKKVSYNDELFNDSLRHLKGISKRRPVKVNKGRDMAFFREENGRSKPTTQFFAANENKSKLPLICHRFDIFFKEHIQNDESG